MRNAEANYLRCAASLRILRARIEALTRSLDTAASLSTFAERGRVVEEVGDSNLRQLLVDDYRLIYRVHEDRIVIRAFLHGARDFSKWRRDEKPEL